MDILSAGGSASAAPSSVIDVSEATFQAEVLERSKETPVVIDFWAPWCGPCRTLGPILEKLAQEAQGAFVLAKVNVDENQRLASMFRVQSIPAVVAVVGGKIVEQFAGALPESQVRTWLQRFIKIEESDPLAVVRELEESDPEEAAARYRLILGSEPENDGVQFSLGRLLLMQGQAEGSATLSQIPASSPWYAQAQGLLPLAEFLGLPGSAGESESETRYRVAVAAMRTNSNEEAIEILLELVARDRGFREDGARKTLLAMLIALGDEHPLVAPARRRLANLLF